MVNIFDDFMYYLCLFIDKKRSYTYDDLILVLRDGWGDPQLKFWTIKNFKLVKIGDQNVVYDIKRNLPIVTYENLYQRIKECHERVGHHGRDKTWVEVGIRMIIT